MAANSAIEWTDATWNCLAGCQAVSPGCTHCYAATMSRRLESMGQADYSGLTTAKHFNGIVRPLPHKLDIPLRHRKPTRFFVNSMSDLFHENVPDEFIRRVFAVMSFAGQHTFQVLTKRAKRMHDWFAKDENCLSACQAEYAVQHDYPRTPTGKSRIRNGRAINGTHKGLGDGNYWPLPNVWLGVSCEDQKRADERIPWLLKTKAAVRFLSCEPLLGPIKLDLLRLDSGNPAHCACGHGHGFTRCQNTGGIAKGCHIDGCNCSQFYRRPGSWKGIDWAIVGGESGPQARPMHPDWARSLRDQCQAAGVSFFMKQMDKRQPIPGDLLIREFPNEFPRTEAASQ